MSGRSGVRIISDLVVLCTHHPPYNSTDPDHWFCKAGDGCIALQSTQFDVISAINADLFSGQAVIFFLVIR